MGKNYFMAVNLRQLLVHPSIFNSPHIVQQPSNQHEKTEGSLT